MTTVLLIIQLMISIVLIGLILIQRSEGGALGIGGGGGGGVMSGRSSANAVTKATTILGTLFIINCLALSVFFSLENQDKSVLVEDKSETGLQVAPDSSKDASPLADEIPAAVETPTAPEETPQTEAETETADKPE
ncbi:MAG: preprotein translocase subunit SecG [Robiginitomaculum sp.]